MQQSMYGTKELKELVTLMMETMRDAPGVGLAAPQLGVPIRVRRPPYSSSRAQALLLYAELWRVAPAPQVIVLEDRAEYIARSSPERAAAMQRASFPAYAVCNPSLKVWAPSAGSRARSLRSRLRSRTAAHAA